MLAKIRCSVSTSRRRFSTSGFNDFASTYLWTQMLDDDAYQWFEDHGGLTRANGDRFRNMVLSRGNTEDLEKMYVTWRGAQPNIGPMLKDLGLVSGPSK